MERKPPTLTPQPPRWERVRGWSSEWRWWPSLTVRRHRLARYLPHFTQGALLWRWESWVVVFRWGARYWRFGRRIEMRPDPMLLAQVLAGSSATDEREG